MDSNIFTQATQEMDPESEYGQVDAVLRAILAPAASTPCSAPGRPPGRLDWRALAGVALVMLVGHLGRSPIQAPEETSQVPACASPSSSVGNTTSINNFGIIKIQK